MNNGISCLIGELREAKTTIFNHHATIIILAPLLSSLTVNIIIGDADSVAVAW